MWDKNQQWSISMEEDVWARSILMIEKRNDEPMTMFLEGSDIKTVSMGTKHGTGISDSSFLFVLLGWFKPLDWYTKEMVMMMVEKWWIWTNTDDDDHHHHDEEEKEVEYGGD